MKVLEILADLKTLYKNKRAVVQLVLYIRIKGGDVRRVI